MNRSRKYIQAGNIALVLSLLGAGGYFIGQTVAANPPPLSVTQMPNDPSIESTTEAPKGEHATTTTVVTPKGQPIGPTSTAPLGTTTTESVPDDTTTSTEAPPVTDPPVTDPPTTDTVPPVTDPPITQPPVTEPPTTVPPPVTEPPTTAPPETTTTTVPAPTPVHEPLPAEWFITSPCHGTYPGECLAREDNGHPIIYDPEPYPGWPNPPA